MLETAIDHGAQQLGLEDEITEIGRVDADIMTPEIRTQWRRKDPPSQQPWLNFVFLSDEKIIIIAQGKFKLLPNCSHAELKFTRRNNFKTFFMVQADGVLG